MADILTQKGIKSEQPDFLLAFLVVSVFSCRLHKSYAWRGLIWIHLHASGIFIGAF